MSIELLPITRAAELKAMGIHYPETEDQLRWMYRQRIGNGLSEAFTRVNGRICFKPARYLELTQGGRHG